MARGATHATARAPTVERSSSSWTRGSRRGTSAAEPGLELRRALAPGRLRHHGRPGAVQPRGGVRRPAGPGRAGAHGHRAGPEHTRPHVRRADRVLEPARERAGRARGRAGRRRGAGQPGLVRDRGRLRRGVPDGRDRAAPLVDVRPGRAALPAAQRRREGRGDGRGERGPGARGARRRRRAGARAGDRRYRCRVVRGRTDRGVPGVHARGDGRRGPGVPDLHLGNDRRSQGRAARASDRLRAPGRPSRRSTSSSRRPTT